MSFLFLKSKFQCEPIALEANKFLCSEINKKSIISLNYAIHTQNEELNFYVSHNHEASSLILDFEERWGTLESVKVDGIDWPTFLGISNLQSRKIDLLKVDIEGSEIDFINSLTPKDLDRIGQITIEFHDWIHHELKVGTIALIERLVERGFLALTDAPSHNWPVEMVFINRRFYQFSVCQKILIRIYNIFSFLNYNRNTC